MPLNHNDPFVVNAAQSSRRQVIEFKLSEEVLEQILNGNESIQLDMNQAKLLVGSTSYDFIHAPGNFSDIEVYRLPVGSKQLDLVGNVTSKCTIQRTHTKKAPKKATKHEPLRTTQIIDAKDLRMGTKSTPQISVRRAQSPSPSAAAAASGTAVPLKTRVVQLLASHPRGTEVKELMKLRADQDDLQSILPSVADLSGGRYVLKPETYLEVKIHDWKSYSAKQRDIVVKNASAAFDRLGLAADAPERDILSPANIKRASPPLVAEGYHVIGNMDTTNSKWRSGGGGSESEGLENGRLNNSSGTSSLLKPPPQKKTSAKKSTTSASLPTKRKSTSSSSKSSSSTTTSKASRVSAAVAIPETVPNHSKRGATTPSSSLKPMMGGTPNLGIGSPTVAGRRPSINGNGVSSSSSASAKRGSEMKKTGSKEAGGVGNGYKIPKVGSGTTIPRKAPSPIFAVPPITSQAEYEEVSRQFLAKYEDMKKLKTKIDAKKQLFDQLGAELELAMGTDREMELKRKVEDAFGEEVIDRRVLRRTGEPRSGISADRAASAIAEQSQHLSIRTMAERYKALHHEVETMKRALWEAGNPRSERTDQPGNSTAGGGNG
ncbi:hypothetical protein BGX28_003806 [Mortierella sp. GBA30]|nr:hypothetical protein BGX28_003806 [Mortierella sp. GBA30]